jgi:hypothetical protein
VIRAVYEQLQLQLRHVHPNFPVRPTDRLIEDLKFDPDDMDMAVDIPQRTGRGWKNTNADPFYGRVKTWRIWSRSIARRKSQFRNRGHSAVWCDTD